MKKVIEVINQMQADGVIGPYAVGGAVGATFYLEPAATLDIDIFVSLPEAPRSRLLTMAPIHEYLHARGYTSEGDAVVIEGWPVQFLPPTNALGEEALQQAVVTEVEGVPVRVMTAEHLVAIALQTGRPKDYVRILQFVESVTLHHRTLERVLSQHGLMAEWQTFQARFHGKGE